MKRLVINNQTTSDNQILSFSKQLNNISPCTNDSNLNKSITFTDFMNLPISDVKQPDTYEKNSETLKNSFQEKSVNANSDYFDFHGSKTNYQFNNRDFRGLYTADKEVESNKYSQYFSEAVTLPDFDFSKLPDDLLSMNKTNTITFPETPNLSPLISETAIDFTAKDSVKVNKYYSNEQKQKNNFHTKDKSTDFIESNPSMSASSNSNTSAESFDFIELVHRGYVDFETLPSYMSVKVDNSGDLPKTIVTVKVPKHLESSEEFLRIIYGHLMRKIDDGGGKILFICRLIIWKISTSRTLKCIKFVLKLNIESLEEYKTMQLYKITQ